MKNLKIAMVMMVFLGGLISVNAQRKVVKVYPKHGTIVTTIHKPVVLLHNKVKFHFANGVWYKPRGKKYIVCAAPIGVRLNRLPKGYTVVRVNGRKLYKYKGIWYKKRGKRFVVVSV